MKLKRKGLTIIIASFAAVLTLSTIVVVAYFAVYSNKKNTIRPSENVLQISEEYQPPVEQKVNDNVYKKEISVVNQGNSPCYIRVYADFSDSNVRSRSYFSNNQDGEQDFYSAQRSNTGNTYIANLETVAPNWRFVPDDDEASELAGYYYYTKKVDPGEKPGIRRSLISRRISDRFLFSGTLCPKPAKGGKSHGPARLQGRGGKL